MIFASISFCTAQICKVGSVFRDGLIQFHFLDYGNILVKTHKFYKVILDSPAVVPGIHTNADEPTQHYGQPATIKKLNDVRTEKTKFNEEIGSPEKEHK